MAESTLPINPKKKLAGKVAIITGGASGIGEETARLFAENGSRMVVIGDIQDEWGQQVAASIGAEICSYKHCDVTDEEQVKSLVEWTVQKFGQLDIMFSNAGIISKPDQTVIDLDLSWFDRLIAINTRGMATCVKHAARAMVAGRVRGSIVCMSSVAGSHGGKRMTDYFMSKHAVIGLMKSASMQLGVHGIRVNCVSPYGITTSITSHVYSGMSSDEIEKMYQERMCLKGGALKTRHVAEAVLFLGCNESELISGHDLVVDGGFLLQN